MNSSMQDMRIRKKDSVYGRIKELYGRARDEFGVRKPRFRSFGYQLYNSGKSLSHFEP